MKKIFIVGSLILFAYAGFQPPDGISKFPVANVRFNVQTQNGNYSATIDTKGVSAEKQNEEQEEQAK